MKVTIEIDCGNSAFDFDNGGAAPEVARILKKLGERIQDDYNLPDYELGLYDINGNKVGKFEVEDWKDCSTSEDEDEGEDD